MKDAKSCRSWRSSWVLHRQDCAPVTLVFTQLHPHPPVPTHSSAPHPHVPQALNNNTEAGTVLRPGQRVFLPPFNKDACGSGACTRADASCGMSCGLLHAMQLCFLPKCNTWHQQSEVLATPPQAWR